MAAASLPLRYRLPNPPSLVVGRSAERARLAAAIERAPLSLVVGPGGMGKSTLVRATLHERFSTRVARTVTLGLRPGASVDELLLDLLGALGELAGVAPADRQGIARDAATATAMAIDWAEETQSWIVLDDLQYADARSTLDLLLSIARYARSSRWVATSRTPLVADELAGQVVALEPLDDEQLGALARHVNPALGGEILQRILEASGGSPWQLLQHAANPATAVDPRTTLLAGLPRVATELLSTLGLLRVPIPESKLALAGVLPRKDVMASLAQRGLVERTAAGCRVHDAIRPLLFAPSAEDVHTLGQRLLDADEPALGVEALRLFVEAGDLASARATLDRWADVFFESGLAARVWQIVEPVVEQGFVGVGLRCALSLGSGSALAWATARAAPEGLAERASWMRALWSAREIDATLRAAEQVAEAARAEGDERLSFDALLHRAQCLASAGSPADARAALESLAPFDEDAAARRDVFLALVLVQTGEYRLALALATALVARLPRLGPEARKDIRDELPTVFFNTGRIRAASELTAQTTGELEGTPIVLLRSLRSALRQTILALEAGQLERVDSLCRRLSAFAHASPMQQAVLELVQVKLWIATGEMDRAEGQLARVLEQAHTATRAGVYQWAMACRAMLSIARAEASCLPEWSQKIPLPAGPQAVFLDAYQRIHAARAGAAPSTRIATGPHREVIDADVAFRLADATEAFHAGQTSAAVAALRDAIGLAHEHGLALQQADATLALCEMLVATADAGAREAIDDLATLTAPFPSPRYDSEVRFFRAVAQRDVDLAELEAIAGHGHAPEASRRARAILRPTSGLDRLDATDRRVLDGLRGRGRVPTMDTLGGPSDRWGPAWGMDARSCRAWTPAGRWIDLSRQELLYKMLEVTYDLGGAATKEQLVARVWNIRDYHPLRDDKRIQVSVRRLRTVLEDDPSRPTRFVTTSDGYAFGTAEAVRLAR